MKRLKLLGLAALATTATLASLCVSPAAAELTSLCQKDPGTGAEETCPEGSFITHVHETSVGVSKLLTSINVECEALFLGDALATLASPLVIHGNFTYTECGSCVVEEENGPAEVQVLKEGHEKAIVTGEGLVHVNCSGFVNCRYNGVGLTATAKGPLLASQKNGEVTLSEQTASASNEAGGFLCPKKAKLDITTTPLVATYIAR